MFSLVDKLGDYFWYNIGVTESSLILVSNWIENKLVC